MMKLHTGFAILLSALTLGALLEFQKYSGPQNPAPKVAVITAIGLWVGVMTWRIIAWKKASARSFLVGFNMVVVAITLAFASYIGVLPTWVYLAAGFLAIIGGKLIDIGWEMRKPVLLGEITNLETGHKYYACTVCWFEIWPGHILHKKLSEGAVSLKCPKKCWSW